MSEDVIPKPQPTDPPEVIAALEAAEAHWAKGEQREGLKLLRRAAEAAEQADNDMRALEFARRAADITGMLGASSPPPLPSAPEQVTQEPPQVAARPAAQTLPSPSAPVAPQPAPAAQAPQAPSARASMPPAKPSQAPAPGSAQSASRAQSAAAVLAPTARGQVRVFVKTSSRDKSLYIVRPLDSGKRPPLGTREAVLVFPDD
jgi:hypothetical protein